MSQLINIRLFSVYPLTVCKAAIFGLLLVGAAAGAENFWVAPTGSDVAPRSRGNLPGVGAAAPRRGFRIQAHHLSRRAGRTRGHQRFRADYLLGKEHQRDLANAAPGQLLRGVQPLQANVERRLVKLRQQLPSRDGLSRRAPAARVAAGERDGSHAVYLLLRERP